jgi:hypothetical protein
LYTDTEGNIKVAIGMDHKSEAFEFKSFSDFLVTHSEDAGCLDPTPGDLISSPHSNAFIDLDGDCMPDIFLQKQRVTKRSPLT